MKRAAREAARSEAEGMPGSGGKGKGKEIVIDELWKPSSGAMSFWEKCGIE